jgi:hypothetical protein
MRRFYLFAIAFLWSLMIHAVTVEIDGIAYNINLNTGITEVTSNSAHPYSGDIVIQETIAYEGKEYTVTGIGAQAFAQKNITSITFPNSITSIGPSAFSYCNVLDSVVIPERVTIIPDMAFASSESLRHVILPEGVTLIDNSAFNSCYGLDSLIIPNTVETIEDWAFAGCKNLSYVKMPQQLKKVGQGAFGNCQSMAYVDIPDLSSWAMVDFYNNSANPLNFAKKLIVNGEEITDLVIPDDVTSIGNCTFYNCVNLTSITIGEHVASIGASAFRGCSNVTSIVIGEDVTYIGGWAFNGCSKVTSVTSYPRKVPSTGRDLFDNTLLENANLYVAGAAFEDYNNTEPWNNFKDIIALNIPKHTLSYYLNYVLYKSYTLEEGEYITPEPAPEKEGYEFSGWSEIPERMPKHDVNVTGSLTLISQTFTLNGIHYQLWVKSQTADVTGVTIEDVSDFSGQIDIPSTLSVDGKTFDVTSIGDLSFFMCESLKSISIPASVTTIGKKAFEGCMLQNVFVENAYTHILDNSFSQATYNHAMLYIPKDEWMEAVYHGDFWRFINIRETVANTSNLSEMQAYTMMDRNTFGYMVYDAVNDRTAMTDTYYNVDESSLNNCWQILKKDGNDYLYNIGAKKYVMFNPDGQMVLTERPATINMENGKDGVILGNNTQKQWAFVLNNKVQAEDVVIDSVPMIEYVSDAANQYYLINGMTTTKSHKGLVIIKSKDRKTRKIVK